MTPPLIRDSSAPVLSVGALAADQLRLGEELAQFDGLSGVSLHVDMMDGMFVPQLTVGPGYAKMLPKVHAIDVHLMVDEPLRLIDDVIEAGASLVSFHLESTRHPARVLQAIGGHPGVARGVAVNPGTPLDLVEPLLGDLDFLLLLGINPGWSGQEYLPGTDARLGQARALVDRHAPSVRVGVDGGITGDIVDRAVVAGADFVVSGSAVFSSGRARASAAEMVETARTALARRSA